MAFLSAKDSNHQTTSLYHPQANPVKHIMKPQGKAFKTAHVNGQPYENPLNDFFVGFQTTPYVAIGILPADFFFRNGQPTATHSQAHKLKLQKIQEIQHCQTINTKQTC